MRSTAGRIGIEQAGTELTEGMTMAQFALRWVIDQPGVSVVIPGARSPEQARANAAAAGATGTVVLIGDSGARAVWGGLLG